MGLQASQGPSVVGLDHLVRPSPGVTAVKPLRANTVMAMIVDSNRAEPIAGEWQADDVHYIDMCLTARPTPSRGCFVDWSDRTMNFGEIFYVPAGVRLRAEGSAGRHRVLNLFLPSHPLFEDEEQHGDHPAKAVGDYLQVRNRSVRESLIRISREVREPGFASALLVEGLGLSLMVDLWRLLDLRRSQAARVGGLAPWRLRLIQERVHEDGRAPSLADLAVLCGLSRRHLMRAFLEETGSTLGAYMAAASLDRAKRRLAEGLAPIGTIGEEAGFSSPSGFSAAFRRATGQSPRAYRATTARSRTGCFA
jgi:AraC family transcriptional regulator